MIATSATSRNWPQKKKRKPLSPTHLPHKNWKRSNKIPGLLRKYFRVRVAVRHKGRRSRVEAHVEQNMVCRGLSGGRKDRAVEIAVLCVVCCNSVEIHVANMLSCHNAERWHEFTRLPICCLWSRVCTSFTLLTRKGTY
jgi:hypothetical protein